MSSSCPPGSWKVRSAPSPSVLGSNPTQIITASAFAARALVSRPMDASARVTPKPTMALPVVNHRLVADVESNTVVRGRKEFVISGLPRHEIAGPANREVIDRLVRSKAAFAPVELDVLVGAR